MFATPFICHTPLACSFSQQAFFIPKLQPPRRKSDSPSAGKSCGEVLMTLF
ncbi:MAG: hypothetical protein WAW39_25575 [Prosthecobacter sp.]|uniref:hypothetical protein n=1 Tax=Prosthecobacter sp. TaxID=1965333 RepID=UPI003BAF759C